MPVSIELLKCMTDAHAINALRADFDPLVNTPLEAFLIDRMEALADEANDPDYASLIETLEGYDLELADVLPRLTSLIQQTA